jgi:uncharacterized DUF497 family protein
MLTFEWDEPNSLQNDNHQSLQLSFFGAMLVFKPRQEGKKATNNYHHGCRFIRALAFWDD